MPYDINLCLKPFTRILHAHLMWPMINGLFATLEGSRDDTFPPRSMRPSSTVLTSPNSVLLRALLCLRHTWSVVKEPPSRASLR